MRERGQSGKPVQCLAAVWLCSGGKAEQGFAGDALQRPLLASLPLPGAPETWRSAPTARKKNRILYSHGRQEYIQCTWSMSGQKFLINPQKVTLRGYYDGKNS